MHWRHWSWHHRLARASRFGVLAILGLALGTWLLQGRPTAPIDSFISCAEAGYPVTTTEPPTCRAHGQVFVGPLASPAPTPVIADAQPFEILVEGDSRGTYPHSQEVITTQADWRHYWAQVHSSLATLPPLLPVDFTKSNVVALSLGQQMTSGYNLKVTTVTSGSAGTTVYVTESFPTITCPVSQVVTNRYFIVRTAILTPPVNFRITTDRRYCKI